MTSVELSRRSPRRRRGGADVARLCFLTERLLSGWGVDHVVHRVAHGLGQLGHEVDVLCLRADRSYGPAAYRVRVIDVPFQPLDTLEERVLARPGPILQRSYDAYVVNMYPFFGVASRLRLPFVYFEFGVVDPVGQPPALAALLRRLRDEGRAHQRRARRVATISRFLVEEQVHPRMHDRTDVVYLGADSYGPAPEDAAVAALRARLGFAPGDEVVGYLGRIERGTYKGVDDLVAIFATLRARRPRARLLLMGLADEASVAHYAAIPGVVVRPAVPAEELPVHLAAVDVAASASRWEGFNLPLAEAQRYGRPVVAYRLGAHPEIVAPSGALVDTRVEFAEALEALLADPQARRRRGREAAAFADRFTWANSVRDLAGCLRAAGVNGC
jgi:glycosyltransferase involved in cell wall biosynthesis